MRMVYDLYKDFAIYAKTQGDTVGRKMISPSAGYNGDADFVRLLYTSSIDAMGVNAELYWDPNIIQHLHPLHLLMKYRAV